MYLFGGVNVTQILHLFCQFCFEHNLLTDAAWIHEREKIEISDCENFLKFPERTGQIRWEQQIAPIEK